MGRTHSSKVYGAWFFESHGIPYSEEKGIPVKGWTLVEMIPGRYKSLEDVDLRDKIDAVLEIHPKCDILTLGQGDEMLVFDLREYKQKYWPKIEFPEEHIS